MSTVIFGSTGFIGSWVTRALAHRGDEVVAIVRPDSRTWRIDDVVGVEIVRADPVEWPALIAPLAPRVVVALDWAGVTSRDRNDETVQQGNVARHRELARAAFAAGISRYVGIGSQAEYGSAPGILGEQSPVDPTTAYGRAKVAVQRSLQEEAGLARSEWVWARVFSVFGPLETGTWLLPGLAATLRAGGTPTLASSGQQPWSYLYAADAASAVATLANDPRAHGIYNVGHPDAPALRDSVNAFVHALAPGTNVTFGDADGASLTPSVQRLLDLGWAPRWSPEDGVSSTAAWLDGRPLQDPFAPGTLLPPVPSER